MSKVSSIFFLLTMLLFLSSATSCCTTLIDDTCKNVSTGNPNSNFGFCKTSLQAAPGSRCLNLRGLGLIAVRLFRDNATDTRCYIRELLAKKGLNPVMKMRLQDCLDMYMDGVETLTQAIREYRDGLYFDANVHISAVMTYSTTCEDGFHEVKGLVSPLTKQNDNALRLGSISLSIMASKQKNQTSRQ